MRRILWALVVVSAFLVFEVGHEVAGPLVPFAQHLAPQVAFGDPHRGIVLNAFYLVRLAQREYDELAVERCRPNWGFDQRSVFPVAGQADVRFVIQERAVGHGRFSGAPARRMQAGTLAAVFGHEV